eukprot:SAG11_NODE_771_length_7253_cov_2.635741_3_plen_142_part_00
MYDAPSYTDEYLQANGWVNWVNPPPLEHTYERCCNCTASTCCVDTTFASMLYEQRALAGNSDPASGGCMDPRRTDEAETANKSMRWCCYVRCADTLQYKQRQPLPLCLVSEIRSIVRLNIAFDRDMVGARVISCAPCVAVA